MFLLVATDGKESKRGKITYLIKVVTLVLVQ